MTTGRHRRQIRKLAVVPALPRLVDVRRDYSASDRVERWHIQTVVADVSEMPANGLLRRHGEGTVEGAIGRDDAQLFVEHDQGLAYGVDDAHFMPVALLDNQFATLQEPTPDEHPITVDVGARPADIAIEIVRQLEATAGDSDEAGVERTSGRSGVLTGERR